MNLPYSTLALRCLKGALLALLATTSALAQNSMIGDGFGGRLWYRPTNYGVGSYSAYSLCYSDPCDSSNNQLYGWGSDQLGQLGNGQGPNCSATPVAISGLSDVRYFTAGYLSGAIKNDGTGWIWIDNVWYAYPTQVITDAKFLDVGIFTACFVKEDGTVWSIINNQFGQFGDGTTVDNYTTPVQMSSVTNAVRAAAGYYANYVLLADSTVLAVGSSYNGLLGDPSLTDTVYTMPSQIPGLTGIVDIKAHSGAIAALDGNGSVYCWGLGGYTGDGDLENDTLPELIAGLNDIVAISGCADGVHFLALDAYGNCFAWGDYNVGNIYTGAPLLLSPTLIATDVIDIMAGETFSYIVRSDGSLWAEGFSEDCSIWLDLQDTLRNEFTAVDPSLVPGACPLVGTVAVPSTACDGSSSITISHFGGQAPYQYDIGNGPQNGNVFSNVAVGDHTVTVTDASGCVFTVTCSVDPNGPDPVVIDMGTVANCVDEGYTLPSGTTVFTSGSYVDTTISVNGCDTVRLFDVVLTSWNWLNWQINLCEGETYTLPNGDVVSTPGYYFVDTLEYVGACDTIFSITLVPSNLPPVVAQVATPDSTITAGESILLSPSPGSSFSWYPSTGLSCTTCTFPYASPTETTEYCVIVSDSLFSCGTDTACLIITVLDPSPQTCAPASIYVPTAFSPNANGTNDLQCVQGAACITSMTFNIYDRWGTKVFESTDPNACWDGTYNGQALDPAVFVYSLAATLANGESVERQGNITLIR